MHKSKKFTLILKDGSEAEFVSKRYSVNLENKFIELVGKDTWERHLANGVVDIEITPSKCREDFPHLLDPLDKSSVYKSSGYGIDDVVWEECDLYELGSVYFFFFKYRSSVFGTLQNELNGSSLSAMAQYARALNLMPEDTLKEIKSSLNMDTI